MHTDIEVAIIGAGFAGLGAAIRLRKAGKDSFVIFEQADQVGGTWRENIYPGCACDVPSHLYSFSFEPNPNWTRRYAQQPEILDYLKRCVETYQLTSHIRYNTKIQRMAFVEAAGHWQLLDSQGKQTTARTIIIATGPFSRPRVPALPSLVTFTGKAFHSSHWDTTLNPAQQRIAVVGTGASAIQIVPELAKMTARLTIYQRSAPYVTPRLDQPVSPGRQRLFRHLPGLQKLYRAWIYWQRELTAFTFTGIKMVNAIATRVAKDHLEASLKAPDLRRWATPDYTFGCKRVLVSDAYYPALNRPNVELVTDAIEQITPTGIRTQDGIERPADVIIFCTGFAVADIISSLQIIGRQGINLFDQWQKTGAQAYKGVAIPGFPNLIFLVGPNSGLGHNSIVHVIESQLNYLMSYLDVLQRQPEPAFLDVKDQVQAAYNERIQQQLAHTVWATGCQSWFINRNKRNTTLWPGLATTYRHTTRAMNPADYERVQPQGQLAERV